MIDFNEHIIEYSAKPKITYLQYKDRKTKELSIYGLDITKKNNITHILMSFMEYADEEEIATQIYVMLKEKNLVENPEEIRWYTLLLERNTEEKGELEFHGATFKLQGVELTQYLRKHIEEELWPFDLSDFKSSRKHL